MDSAASKKVDNVLHLDGGSQLTFDGPEKFFPKYGDVLLCMAIIEGYSAVRCPTKGIFKNILFFILMNKRSSSLTPSYSIILIKMFSMFHQKNTHKK